jgi:hypothetical protein
VPDPDQFEDDIKIINESRVPLDTVLTAEGDSMVYVYDFGDNWRHEVVLEKIAPSDAAASPKPVCLAGERRCPPEDVGGPSGYQEFLEVIFEPGHEEFTHFRGFIVNRCILHDVRTVGGGGSKADRVPDNAVERPRGKWWLGAGIEKAAP